MAVAIEVLAETRSAVRTRLCTSLRIASCSTLSRLFRILVGTTTRIEAAATTRRRPRPAAASVWRINERSGRAAHLFGVVRAADRNSTERRIDVVAHRRRVRRLIAFHLVVDVCELREAATKELLSGAQRWRRRRARIARSCHDPQRRRHIGAHRRVRTSMGGGGRLLPADDRRCSGRRGRKLVQVGEWPMTDGGRRRVGGALLVVGGERRPIVVERGDGRRVLRERRRRLRRPLILRKLRAGSVGRRDAHVRIVLKSGRLLSARRCRRRGGRRCGDRKNWRSERLREPRRRRIRVLREQSARHRRRRRWRERETDACRRFGRLLRRRRRRRRRRRCRRGCGASDQRDRCVREIGGDRWERRRRRQRRRCRRRCGRRGVECLEPKIVLKSARLAVTRRRLHSRGGSSRQLAAAEATYRRRPAILVAAASRDGD